VGKDLQGELSEDLKLLKESKALQSLEEILSSEKTREILDISGSLSFFEGTSLMLLREVALQYLHSSEEAVQGEAEYTEQSLPQGENCKTEAELMVLLATLDRKGGTPGGSQQVFVVPEPQNSQEPLPQGESEKIEAERIPLLPGMDRNIATQRGEAPLSSEALQEILGETIKEESLLSRMPEDKTSEESFLSGKIPEETVLGKGLFSEEHTGEKITQKAPLFPQEVFPVVAPKGETGKIAERNNSGKDSDENLSLKTEKPTGEIPLFGEPSKEEEASPLLLRPLAEPSEAPLPEKEPPKRISALREIGEQISRGSLAEEVVQSSAPTSLAGERGGNHLLNRGGAGSSESPQASSGELPRILSSAEGEEASGGKSFQDSQKFLFSSRTGELRESLSSRDAGEKPSFEQHLESRNAGGVSVASASQAPRGAESSVPSGSYTLPQRGLPSLGEGVAATVRIVRTFQGSRAQIIVDPPALGRVTISLQSTDQGMSAVLRVDNEGLRQLLQSQMELLRSSLQQQGVAVTSLSVDVRQGGDQASSGGNPREDQASRRRAGGIPGSYDLEGEDNLPTYQLDMERGLLSWTA
jgi:hypothetical protein